MPLLRSELASCIARPMAVPAHPPRDIAGQIIGGGDRSAPIADEVLLISSVCGHRLGPSASERLQRTSPHGQLKRIKINHLTYAKPFADEEYAQDVARSIAIVEVI